MEMHHDSTAKTLTVRSIELERVSRACVTLSAPVLGKEAFYFTVPKEKMQEVVTSVEVRDTRGSTPRISFPSPMTKKVEPLILHKNSAWHNLLTHHQGAHVELHTSSGPIEGYFMGFQKQPNNYDKDSIMLLREGNVYLHQADAVSAISFKGAEVGKRLERYASTQCRVQEQDSVYRINVTADAVGAGELFVRYVLWNSSHSPWYDLTYAIHAEVDNETSGNDGNNPEYEASAEIPKVRVICHAVIRNPLHYDVTNARFILRTGHCRGIEIADAYPDKPLLRKARSESSSSSGSPVSSRSGYSRSKTESLPPSNHSTAQRGYDSDTESNKSWDTMSDSEWSRTSNIANAFDHSHEWEAPGQISIKEGESLKVLQYEMKMDGGVGHLYSKSLGVCKRAVWLHNTTDRILDAGHMLFFAKGVSVSYTGSWLKPLEGSFTQYNSSGCAVEDISFSERGEVVSASIRKKSLVAKVLWLHTHKYLFHNKEDKKIFAFLGHHNKHSTGREVTLKARLYPSVSGIEHQDDEDQGVELEEYCKRYNNLPTYRFHVESKQKCLVVVHETKKALETYEIFECSRKEIARLEQKGVMGPALAEKVRQFADMKREIKKNKETQKLFRQRLSSAEKYEKGLAEVKAPAEKGEGKDGLDEFFEAVKGATESMLRIEREIDELESHEVKLEGQMRRLKQEVCAMKEIALHNENGKAS